MEIDQDPTAAASYARTLMARGCPQRLAFLVGNILARADNTVECNHQEKELIGRAYAYLRDK